MATHHCTKFCSPECTNQRKRFREKQSYKYKTFERDCLVCSESFTTNHALVVTCSPKCRKARESQLAAGRSTAESRAAHRAYMKEYNKKPEVIESNRIRHGTDEAKRAKRERRATPQYQEVQKAYHRSDRYREADRKRKPRLPGWEIRKHLPHTMYLIRFTQGNKTYIKPGITGRTTRERFANDILHSRMSNFEILDSITFKDFETCNVAESIIHDATLDSHVRPVIAFYGSVNECRQPEALEQIISMFDSARAGLDNTN